jgi:hypothetical protein
MTQALLRTSLYELDYFLWTEEIVNKLRMREINELDLENLIEEIEDLGRSQKQALKSRLRELLEHILKRTYINMPDCDRGWVESIDKQRIGLRDLIKDSPSLKPYFFKVFDESFDDALKIVRRGYPQVQFPDSWQFSQDLETLLNVDFWLE